MPKLFSFGLALSLALTGITPAQADIKATSITQSLDQDGRLGSYGPYRLLTEEERRWLLQAQKGGPESKPLFQKTSTQAALIVLRYQPLFRGNLGVQSKPWGTDISAPLLISMATGKMTLADYFKKVQVYALETPNPTVVTKPSTPITPTAPPPNRAPRPQFDRSTSRKVQPGQPLKVSVQVKDEAPAKTQATIQLLEGEKVLVAVRQKGKNFYTTTFGPDVTSRLNPQKSYSLRTIVSDGELFGTVRQGVQIAPITIAIKPEQTKPPAKKPSSRTPQMPPVETKPGQSKPETQGKIPPPSETKPPEVASDKVSAPDTKTPAVEPTEKVTPENKPPEILQRPDVKSIEVPSEPIATQTSIPIQIAFSDQTSGQIIPGQSLNVETIVTASQPEEVTLSTQLLDKDTLVKTITLMAKGNGIYQGGLSGQETADLIPGRSYQLKSVAEDSNSKAEAIEDLTIAQVITESDEPFDLQIPTFFNIEGIPRATGASSSLRVTRSLNATYRFTVDIPREANRGVGEFLLEFPESIVPPSPGNIRVLANNNPIEIQKADLNGPEFDIKLKDAVPPGSSMTVEVQGIRNPILGGNYDFKITVLPAGDLPAFYALSPLRLIFVDRQ
ncbi:MAG: DUF2808 domain-containing protein [Gloeobacterales cyanobacterium]